MEKIKKFRIPRKLKKIYKDPIRFARLLKQKGFKGYSVPSYSFIQKLNFYGNFGRKFQNVHGFYW